MNITEIQAYLNEHDLDGWLLADFHARNNIAVEMLRLKGIVTRRSFYWIPAEGDPIGMVHAIERDKYHGLPGEMRPYSGYKQLESELKAIMSRHKRVAMEYSAMGRLPYIGLVDAGTIELIRSFGCDIVSSADLVANFDSRLQVEQIASHRMAARNLIEIKSAAHEFISKSLRDGREISEYDVQQFILQKFDEYDMTTAMPPTCAVDGNAGNPHYSPTVDATVTIKNGQLVLIDLWARLKIDRAVYGDITWMAYTGAKSEIPSKYVEMFDIIKIARDTAVDYVRKRIDSQPVYGSQVDDACRQVIEEAGYGEYFTHRTGHSITTSEHGTGPNIDNLETEDKRRLQRGHLFSIEPGIYMDDCGFRTEIDCLITPEGIEVTTLPLQNEIVALLE